MPGFDTLRKYIFLPHHNKCIHVFKNYIYHRGYTHIYYYTLYFFLLTEVSKPSHQPRSKRKTDRLTAYACEDSTLNITCGQNLYLDVIRANYGRFSITICNDHGNTDWKVDCQAGRTLRVMQARCSNQHDCIVPVQTSIFGDPCPGTFKYIEVHYACRKGKKILTFGSFSTHPWKIVEIAYQVKTL